MIKVTGIVADTGASVEAEVEVIHSSTSFIHTLAARSLISDREDGQQMFSPSVTSSANILKAHLEADIIRLGTTYGLTSKHTSFVAVDQAHVTPINRDGIVSIPLAPAKAIEVDPRLMAQYEQELQNASANALPDEEEEDLYLASDTKPEDTPITAIARLQQFDGHFLLSAELLQTMSLGMTLQQVRQILADTQVREDVLATCLAYIWIEKKGKDEGQEMLKKSLEWLGRILTGDVLEELGQWAYQTFFVTK